MTFLIVSTLCAFFQVALPNPISHWTLLPHVLVVEVDGTRGQLPLSCLTSPEQLARADNKSQDIFWRTNGVKEPTEGNSYLVQLEESLGGANYTCHSQDGSLLNHTEVLIQKVKTNVKKILVKNDNEDYLTCSAQNLNGEFRCSWTWDSSRVGKVAFIQVQRVSYDTVSQCSVDTSGRRWTCSSGQSNFICSVDDSGLGILCVDKQHCPYAEENQQIQIKVFVKTSYFLVENYSQLFFLSEIVKPEKVMISKVNSTMIEWTYPSSWSCPYSYFPLTFQIAQLKGHNSCNDSKLTKTLTVHSPDICQFEVKHKTKVVCIRAKDALSNSQWSEWSQLRLRMDKKNRKSRHHQNRRQS